MSTGQFGDVTPLDELCDAAREKEALIDMIETLIKRGDRLFVLVGTEAHGEDSKAAWGVVASRATQLVRRIR